MALAGFFLPISAGNPSVATESELLDAIVARFGPVKAGRGIGYAIFEADGRTGFGTTISGEFERAGTVGAPTNPQFTPAPTFEYDVEYKLLEDVAAQIRPQSSGRVVIVINKNYVCASCTSVVQQFKAAYPGMQIEIRTASDRLAATPFD